jgi:hypothetical protein
LESKVPPIELSSTESSSSQVVSINSPPAPSQNQEEATKTLINLALDDFSILGEPKFPLNSLYEPAANRQDAGITLGFEVADCRFVETVFESV